jgi:nucleoside-diphosphate-sugar epimerase
MRVFIQGATGVLGRGLVRHFTARGHEAVGLTRDERGDRVVRELGGVPRRADVFDRDSLARAAEGAAAVVHAATSIPTKRKPSAADWEANDRLRRDGTRELAAAAALVGARIYLQQSIVWVARPDDNSFFDERSEPRPDRITASALDAERIAREAAAARGFEAAVLRCGVFYGADAAHTREFAEGLRRRALPIVGSGEAELSFLHAEDAAAAFVAAAEAGRGGLWHVVDDRPTPIGEFLGGLAARIGARPPRHVPAWLARIVAGSYTTDFVTRPMRTSNALFKRDVGWSPAYPTVDEGLDQVVAEWAEGGRLAVAV